MHLAKTLLFIIALSLTGCNQPSNPLPMPPHEPPPHMPRGKKIHHANEGALCIQRTASKTLSIMLFPLGTACASSSRYYAHDHHISIQPRGTELHIETYGSYSQSGSPMATADCGGAGTTHQRSRLLSSALMHLYWGSTPLGILPSSSYKLTCYRKRGNHVVEDYRLRQNIGGIRRQVYGNDFSKRGRK